MRRTTTPPKTPGTGEEGRRPWATGLSRLRQAGLAARLVAVVTLLFLAFTAVLGTWISAAVRGIYLREAASRAEAMATAANAYLASEWRRCAFAVTNPVVQRRFAPLLAGSNVDAVTRAMRELRESSRASFLHAYAGDGTFVTSSEETAAASEPPSVVNLVATLRGQEGRIAYVTLPQAVLGFEGLPISAEPGPALAAAAVFPLRDDFGDTIGSFLWVRLLSGDQPLVGEVGAALGGEVAFALDGLAVATTLTGPDRKPALGHAVPASDETNKLIRVAGGALQGHFHSLATPGPSPAVGLWTGVPVSGVLGKARVLSAQVYAVGLLAVAAFGALAAWVTRRSLRHVAPLLTHMDEVSRGQLRRLAQVTEDDEMGRLAQGLDRTVESLRLLIGQVKNSFGQVEAVGGHLADTAQALSQGSRHEAEALSALVATSATFETVVGTVGKEAADASNSAQKNLAELRRSLGSLQSLARDAGRVLEAADKTEEAMAGLALGQEQVSVSTGSLVERLTDSATAVQEIDTAVGEVRDLTDNAREVARRLAEEASQRGRGAMERAGAELARTGEVVADLVAAVQGLGKRSVEIGDIIGIISSVASQSKLLALNASILAAQAGEHGRGFAVVADNMRALSESTSNSARTVVDLIQNMQEDSRRAVEESARGLEALARSNDEVAKLVAVLRTVIGGADETSRLVDRIAALTEGQSAASSRVAGTLQMIAATAEEVSASMHDQSQAGKGIVDLAEDTRTRSSEMKRLADRQAEGLGAMISTLEEAARGAERLHSSAAAADQASRVVTEAVAVIGRVVQENRKTASSMLESVGRLQTEADQVRENLGRFTLD